MGSCLSPSIADVIMDILIDRVKHELNFELLLIKKYVDDLFLVIPKEKIDTTITSFNNYELEIDGRIPFLDMTLMRDVVTGDITTEWFKKPSGRILDDYYMYFLIAQVRSHCG